MSLLTGVLLGALLFGSSERCCGKKCVAYRKKEDKEWRKQLKKQMSPSSSISVSPSTSMLTSVTGIKDD